MKTLVVTTLLLSGAALNAAVTPLTPETAPIAIAQGHAVRKASDLCFSDSGLRTKMTIPGHALRSYNMVIMTPACGLAVRAFEAKRKYETFAFDPAQIPPPDDQVVTVTVDPSSNLGGFFSAAGTTAKDFSGVERVVIKRGATVVQPLKAEAHDVTFSNAYGKTVTYKGGTFEFPLSAFDPSGTAVIVIITDTGVADDEVARVMTIDDLKKLR